LSSLFFIYMIIIYMPIWRRPIQQPSLISHCITNDSVTPSKRALSYTYGDAPETEKQEHDVEQPLNVGISTYGAVAEKHDEIKSSRCGRYCGTIIKVLSIPFVLLFRWTIPNCQENTPTRKYFIFSLVMSIAYVAVFSEIALLLTHRISDGLNIPHAIAGVTLLALGAQIPDTITSVALAKNGHADAAVCNAIGSQVINITLGSGLPWLVFAMINKVVIIPYNNETTLSYTLGALIAVYLILNLRGICCGTKGFFIGLCKSDGVILLMLYILANVVIITC